MNKVKFKCLTLFAIVGFAAAHLYGLSLVQAATSPTLGESGLYSVLGGQAVTCTGSTTTNGRVGVSSGTSITGFPVPCTAGGGTHSNDASAIAAQADNLTVFGTLNQACDLSFGAVDLSTTNFAPFGGVGTVGPGVFCSTSSFSLSGNLTLTGSGVWIFKTVSTLITSPGSSVTGGDPCNVWWRIGSSATLDTTTSFIGSIFALNGVTALNNGATVNGRVLAQDAGTVTLNNNTFTGPICAAPPTTTTTTSTTTTTIPGGGGTTTTTTTIPGATTTTTTIPGTTTTTPGTGIPAAGNWGMVILALAFLGAIAWMVRARRSLR